jgi:hypothetical protein
MQQACEASPAFARIMHCALPLAVARFAEKSLDYGDNAANLGIKGQFSDINRKFGKLKRALWDGQELVGEQPDEILQDMIAHCLLALDMLEQAE